MLVDRLTRLYSRRGCFKFLGASSIAITHQSLQATPCTPNNIKDSLEPLKLPEEQLIYYLSGQLLTGFGRMAILLKIPHSTKSYVSRVVLSDSLQATVAARYFKPDQASVEGFPPYIIFNHIDGRLGNTYTLTIQVTADDSSHQVFRYVFDSSRMERSQWQGRNIPELVDRHLKESHNNHPTTSSQFGLSYYQQGNCSLEDYDRCLAQHFPQVQISRRDSNQSGDGQFQIRVHLTHPDYDQQHYIRYIAVCDPVGRLMGILRRAYGDQQSIQPAIINRLSPSERQIQWQISANDDPNINECPYIMVFVDDVQQALSETLVQV